MPGILFASSNISNFHADTVYIFMSKQSFIHSTFVKRKVSYPKKDTINCFYLIELTISTYIGTVLSFN